MPEPSATLLKLREMEEALAKCQTGLTFLRAQVAFNDIMVDEVLIPAILLLAGQGYRDHLAGFLRQARESILGAEDLPEVSRHYESERVDGWLRAVQAMPAWLPLQREDRHPDE